ncbi:MAG TPA: hypothetical protein VM843_06950 [Flavisolibacter sp.]|nr:hypothetical protein [Flavisolibacter sp.]
MSSNQPHIAIDRSNYEEAFLLYIDGELTPAQKAEVETFAAANPDLAEELDLLSATRLPDEALVLEDKSALFANSIKAGFTDESLLLFIDNELPGDEHRDLETRINSDDDLKLQYDLLKKVKLDASENLVYPYKKELYRTERRAVPLFWMQLAAAVVLLLTIAAFWLIGNNSPEAPPIVKAPITPVVQDLEDSSSERSLVIERSPEETDISRVAKSRIKVAVPGEKKEVEKTPVIAVTDRKAPVQKSPSFQGVPDNRDRAIASVDLPEYTRPSVEKSNAIDAPPTQQTFNTPGVTTKNPSPYTSIDAPAADAGVSFAVTSDNTDKKGSVRGFLRKATRFIERRTGINPVNEDERLLIGVVAVKL